MDGWAGERAGGRMDGRTDGWDGEQDNSSTRQLIDTVFGDNSSTQLKTTHRHFLKTIHRHIIMLKLYTS